MHRIVVVGAIVITLAGMGITRVAGLEQRLAELDDFRRQAPRREQVLEAEIDRMQRELQEMGTLLTEAAHVDAADATSISEVQNKLTGLEQHFARTTSALEGQTSVLEALKRQQSVRTDVETRLEMLESGVSRWDGLAQTVSAATRMAERATREIDQLNAGREIVNEQTLWRSMVGPTVQLAGDTTVGSGVLLASQQVTNDEWVTYLLTSWHVVRDIRSDSLEDDPPIPVAIHHEDGFIEHDFAALLHHDVSLDAALLRLESTEQIDCGARLPTKKELRDLRIFHPVIAVGCPLGNDPIPTRGEISDLHHRVDGNGYWMINAPTYIGNSGGGIYDGETRALLGIFSKIYTHGTLNPTVVPHMGLVTPMDQIYEWLEGIDEVRLVASGSGMLIERIPAPK